VTRFLCDPRESFALSILDPMRLRGGEGGEQEKSVNGDSIACETDLKWCSNNSSSLFLFLFLFFFSCSFSLVLLQIIYLFMYFLYVSRVAQYADVLLVSFFVVSFA